MAPPLERPIQLQAHDYKGGQVDAAGFGADPKSQEVKYIRRTGGLEATRRRIISKL